MSTIEISKTQKYEETGVIDTLDVGKIVKTGFGGRTLALCVEDAKEHLATAKLVQFAHIDNRLVGFAMYETFSEGKDLYLNGIVIERQSQTMNIGSLMVGRAFYELGARTLFAVTRNPAILRIMQTVCDYVQPSPETQEGVIKGENEISRLANCIGLPPEGLPYHRNRYPSDLYAIQPKHSNPVIQSEFVAFYDLVNVSDAVLLVGGLHNDK